jgi:hypoxanthine phosphoribosyltransferase
MHSIRIHDKTFRPFLSAEKIDAAISRIAGELNNDYKGRKPLFIAILNGSFMFASELFKKLTIDSEICFIKLASYKGMRSTGHTIIAIGLDIDVYGRDIVIVEDIIDTGKTLTDFLPQLTHQQPASLKIAALLHKKEATVYPIPIDYLGFTIPDKFVVGFGLDYDGLGRNIPELYEITDETTPQQTG